MRVWPEEGLNLALALRCQPASSTRGCTGKSRATAPSEGKGALL